MNPRKWPKTDELGLATIVGTLNIARPTNFIPSVNDAFAILTYEATAAPSAP
jgi:hypothetical protein